MTNFTNGRASFVVVVVHLITITILILRAPVALAWTSVAIGVAPSTKPAAAARRESTFLESSATVDYLSSLSLSPPPCILASANAAPPRATPTTSTPPVEVPPSSCSRADLESMLLLPNQSPLTMDDDPSITLAQTLRTHGVCRADSGGRGGLSRETAEELRRVVDEALENSIEEVESFRCPRAYRFANVLEKGHRWDLLLPFGEDDGDDGTNHVNGDGGAGSVVLRAMDELLKEGSQIGIAIEELLGPTARLYELACLVSDPGSKKQEIHPDILMESSNDDQNDNIPLIACFVSLQDIDETMGPTVFLPGTATTQHHRRINDPSRADDMLRRTPSRISTLRAGDCALYDPRILHAGGGNESHLLGEQTPKRRRLFYFTFLREDAGDMSHDMNPGSVRPDVKLRNLSLAEVRREAAAARGGGAEAP